MNRGLGRYLRGSAIAIRHPGVVFSRVWYGMRRACMDNLCRFGYYDYPNRIIMIAGLPLSGTTWVKNLIARVPGYFTRATPMPIDVEYRQDICDSAFSKLPKWGNTLFKTHTNPTEQNLECMRRNGVKKIVVTYRDLRDVLVSYYYRLIEFPKPRDAFDYIDCRSLGREASIDRLLNDVAVNSVAWIRGWKNLASREPHSYYFVKYEDLAANTIAVFGDILDFLGIYMSEAKMQRIVDLSRGKSNVRKNMNCGKLLPWGYASNFRSGKVGGWKDELSEAHIAKCKSMLGPALIELGYEADMNW